MSDAIASVLSQIRRPTWRGWWWPPRPVASL